MEKNILIVDDEKEIVDLVELYLRNTYNVLKSYNGEEALEIIKNNNVDLAIVDIMMPSMDGYSLIRVLREKTDIPIIIISAKNEGYDKIVGLEIGADDYVTKPFDPLELLARVKAQIRRYCSINNREGTFEIEEKKTNFIKVGDVILNKENFSFNKNGNKISLTSTEYKILEVLMTNTNRVFTKKYIFETVWNEPYFYDDNAIMVHISKLRDKIEENSKNPKYLKTVRGLGYRFEGAPNEN
jgi:DNA-binding response OmpR family regulator